MHPCVLLLIRRLLRIIAEQFRYLIHLRCENETLKRENGNLRVLVRNLQQAKEALGDDNRLFAYQADGKYPNEERAVIYYLEHGGPEGFAARMRIEKAKRRHKFQQEERELLASAAA